MKDLPDSENSLVVRTDFSDQVAWARICSEIEAPVGEFRAYVSFVDDPAFDGLGISDLSALGRRGPFRGFIFVVDRVALTDAEHPILVLDLVDEPGRTFRVVPREMWSVENNLSIANMDFSDFADSTDPDGVLRGFPDA
ncbi:MAG: hypothetical protein NVSMB22_01700 [Chloroflexota bacterium]